MVDIKVVKQRDIKDCGACCLASIIEYYKGYVPIEKIRLDTNTNEEGTNALNLIAASKKYGFDAMGVKVDHLLNDAIKLPAIAHTTLKNGLEHFVVIYKITNKKVYIMDPSKGKIVMTINDFKKIWNKVLLLFYPKQKIIFMHKENTLLSVFIKLFFEEKKLFISIFFTSVILTIFTILSSYYFKVVIESIQNNKDEFLIKIVILSFLFLLIMKLIFNNLRKNLENHLNKNIDCLLLSNFLTHIFNLPLEILASRSSGEIMTRVNELSNIKSLFTDIVISSVLDFLLMLISIPILYNINNNLFFILLFIVIIYFFIGVIASKILYKKVYCNIEKETELNSVLIENITMSKSIKNLNQTKKVLLKIESHLANYLFDSFKLMKFVNGENNLKLWINELGLFVINTAGFYLLLNNKITITEIITFNTLMNYYLNPIKNLIDVIPRYNFLKASFVKLNEFLSVEQESLGNKTTLSDYSLELKNVYYSYNNYEDTINNLSVFIPSGTFLLLKGKSGSGKSTICKLLEKYITDYKGSILIGNVNIKDYSNATIRDNITYISQDESLFTGTIKENIIWDRNISESKFFEVCSLCKINEIVDKKPLRYETMINNDTHYLSGGERQRIILARALLKESSIYLIDETLSEVDYSLERKIINNLKTYLKNKTVIYITHKNQDDLFDTILNIGDNHGL